MKKQNHLCFLAVMAVALIAVALVAGCKKKAPQETPPPPPPPIEEPVVQEQAPDTTGQAEREMRARMEADRARIQTVYFDFDRSDIRADQRDEVNTNAEIFRTWPQWAVTVEGHCDERGTNEYNLALGERRAIAAKNALVANGVDAAKVTTISYGEERAATPGATEDAWAKNRRAEFKVQ